MNGYSDESVGMKWIDGRFLINRKTGEIFPFEENIAANPVFAECNEHGDIIDGKSPVYEPEPEPEDPINIDQIDALLTLKYEAEDELEIANIHLNNLSPADKDFSDDRDKDNERIRELEGKIDKINSVLEPDTPGENDSSVTTVDDFNRRATELYDSEFHGKVPIIKSRKPQVVPIKEPIKKDDWFLAIRDAAKSFEEENRYTPDKAKLWSRLITNPPSSYGIKYEKEKGRLLLSEKLLDRENFNKRYDRYYPDNPQ